MGARIHGKPELFAWGFARYRLTTSARLRLSILALLAFRGDGAGGHFQPWPLPVNAEAQAKLRQLVANLVAHPTKQGK